MDEDRGVVLRSVLAGFSRPDSSGERRQTARQEWVFETVRFDTDVAPVTVRDFPLSVGQRYEYIALVGDDDRKVEADGELPRDSDAESLVDQIVRDHIDEEPREACPA